MTRINHVLFHSYNPMVMEEMYIYIYMCSNSPQNLACVLHGQPLTCVSTTREMIAQSTRSDMGSHMRAHGGLPQRLQRALWKEAEATVHPLDASASLLPPNSTNWPPSLRRDFAISHGLVGNA